ncbi:MAG: hypothetical protein IPL04_06195 [Chitinophagaceae bacterium]|nr:hypothetical protein [Chitinophagaceae bacterium]
MKKTPISTKAEVLKITSSVEVGIVAGNQLVALFQLPVTPPFQVITAAIVNKEERETKNTNTNFSSLLVSLSGYEN